jgi:hypothetical protein
LTTVAGAEALGGLGGVLGDVAGHLLRAQLLGVAIGSGDIADIELLAPPGIPGRLLIERRARHPDSSHRRAERLLEEHRRKALRWRGQTARTAAGGGRVQADDRVEVNRPPTLELGHLGIGNPHQPAQLPLLQADQAAKGAVHGDGGPPPQLRSQGVPQHLGLGVIAGRTQGLAQPRVALVVTMPAAGPEAMETAGTLPVGVTGQHQPPLRLARMDPAEGRGGEGDEQPRMLTDRLGDALAALQAGRKELVGIGPVDGRTGRAARLPASAARLEQHPIRLPLGHVDLPDLTRLLVGVLDPAGQADRVVAVAGLSDQLGPPLIAGSGPFHDLAEDAGEQLAHPGRVAHAGSSSTSRSVAVVAVLVVPRKPSARRASPDRSRSSR